MRGWLDWTRGVPPVGALADLFSPPCCSTTMKSFAVLKAALPSRSSFQAVSIFPATLRFSSPSSSSLPSRAYSTSPDSPPAPVNSTAPSTSNSPSPNTLSPTKPPVRLAVLDELQAAVAAFPREPRSKVASQYNWRDAFDAKQNAIRGSSPSYQSSVPAVETPDTRWSRNQPAPYPEPLTTTSARSFQVFNGNVGLAYRRLNKTLMENNIRRELKRQERFESGSDKRVRLDSERHRKRFAVAVGKAVSLSRRMKDL